jgi:hypothetical protein
MITARRYLPLRFALIVALLLSGLALGPPGAERDGALAMPATQIPGNLTWSFGAATGPSPVTFTVRGVELGVPAGTTQLWTMELAPGSSVQFRAAPNMLTFPSQNCQLLVPWRSGYR